MATCSTNLTVSNKVTEEAAASDSRDGFSLAIPIVLNVVLLFVSIIVLLVLTRWKRAKEVFLPKTAAAMRKTGEAVSPFHWFRDAYAVDMEESISIDGRIVVRFLLVGMKFSGAGTLGACVLMPLYSMAGGNVRGSSRYSVSNLTDAADAQTHVIWLLVLSSYFYVAIFIWLMRAEWRYFVIARQRHFARRARGELGPAAAQAQCSLMMENVPSKFRSNKKVMEFFAHLFDDKIFSCSVQRDTLMLYHLKALKSQTDRVTGYCHCCQAGINKQLERIVQIETELLRLARRAEGTLQGFALDGHLEVEEMAKLFALPANHGDGSESLEGDDEPGAQLRPTSTAFVTLRRVSERVLSEQSLLFSLESQERSNDWVVAPSPEARDIVWANVGVPYQQVRNACKLGTIGCSVGVLVWSVPVTGIQTLASEENLRAWFPKHVLWVSLKFPVAYKFAMEYLPVLALMVLIELLPHALRFLAENFEFRKTKTDINRSVMWRNFLFQFFSLWLTVFSSSLMDSFRQIIDRPSCMSTILGGSIPKVSFYFLSFVIARIGTSMPLLLLRIPAIYSLLSRTKPDLAHCVFEREVPNLMIIFVLALMYCVVAPAMMPACFIFFALSFGIYKWLFVHVYETEIDFAGELFYPIFDGIMIGVLFGISSVGGLASLYAGTDTWGIWAMGLLPFVIFYFYYDCTKKFGEMSRVMPFEVAVDIDRGAGVDMSAFREDYYLDPMLQVNPPPQPEEDLSIWTDSDSDGDGDDDVSEDSSSSDDEEACLHPARRASVEEARSDTALGNAIHEAVGSAREVSFPIISAASDPSREELWRKPATKTMVNTKLSL